MLKKMLANERKWLSYADMSKADVKIREGVRMAKERIPQLEQAIGILSGTRTEPAIKPEVKDNSPPQRQRSKSNQVLSTFLKRLKK